MTPSALELNLNYPIFGDGVEYLVGLGVAGLIAWLYYFIIVASSIAAFSIIVWGGIEYLTSIGNPNQVRSAIDRIQNALIGLFLVLISGLFMGTINPGLLFLEDPSMPFSGMGGPVEFPEWPESPFPEEYYFGDPVTFDPEPGGPDPGPGGPNPGQGDPYGCPTTGGLSSPFGNRCRIWDKEKGCNQYKSVSDPRCIGTKCWALHPGIDIKRATCRTNNYPVYATANGTVTFAANNGSYGYRIDIRHDDTGYVTRYAHLKTLSFVSVGSRVTSGQQIATMGGDPARDGLPAMPGAGSSTGCHLHYEVIYKGKALNPENFLELPCYL